MKRKAIIFYIVLAAALAVLALAVSITLGRTCTVRVDLGMYSDSAEDLSVELEDDVDSVELIDRRVEGEELLLTFRGVHSGRFFVSITDSGDMGYYDVYYVHPLNIITHGYYFGRFDGDRVIPACVTAYLIILLAGMIVKYRIDMRRNMYQYRNIRDMGLILFLGVICLHQSLQLIWFSGLMREFQSMTRACGLASFFLLPVSFIVSAVVTVSNIVLMKREGKTWRNMLGCIVGVLYCFGMLLPRIVSWFLERSPVVDIHNEQAAGPYIEMAVEGIVFSIVFYLVCILAATIILGLKSAKHIPKFDKDYILILGCKVRRDGTLTPLLRGRADRAVEFARMQEEATGKKLIFVPSGGKGSDETVSEAEAIRNYLVGIGIPEEQIMMEDRSENTYENLGNSMALIREREGGEDAKVAFSTTNYHVMRSGLYATKQGFLLEGIGSGTKSYFWINAFFREFIATLQVYRKIHIPIMAVLVVLTLVSTVLVYWSNQF